MHGFGGQKPLSLLLALSKNLTVLGSGLIDTPSEKGVHLASCVVPSHPQCARTGHAAC